jgi:uncharacterized surface protein with fasciclin (FAS1) repeats
MNVIARNHGLRRGMLAASLMALGILAIGASPSHAGEAGKKDIVDTAVSAGSFKTLATALQAAGLVDALKGAGPYTVFAPTDAAFAKLPAGTLDNLLKPENKDKLKDVLLYHVVSGKIMAADIKGEASPKTLEGAALAVKSNAGGVTVNGAKVTSADIGASNGVIHVIDAVVLPPTA